MTEPLEEIIKYIKGNGELPVINGSNYQAYFCCVSRCSTWPDKFERILKHGAKKEI